MSAAPGDRSRAAAGALHVAALAAVFVALAAWTWRTWPDVLVDFGRELYVPWRLVEGDVLYRELAYFNGPLSPYLNALAFRVFGVGLSTLVGLNLAILAGIVALLHALLRGMADARSATLACAAGLALFGFSQYVGIGNYNYVTPYSHEATHGLLLALATLAALHCWSGRGALGWVALAGACVGLAFLTKPEMFAGAAAGSGAALVAHGWRERAPRLRVAAVFVAAALAPVALALGLLALALPVGLAARGVLGAWPGTLGGEVARLPFYQHITGLDAPLANLGWMLAGTAALALVLAPGLALSRVRARGPWRWAAAAAPFALVGALFVFVAARVGWIEAGRPLPLLVAVIAAVAAWRVRSDRSPRSASTLAFALLALVLLAKLALAARLDHYGFALALPAALLVCVALVAWIPAALEARGADPLPFRAGALALVLGLVALHLAVAGAWRGAKRLEVGRGPDRFYSDVERGREVAAALRWIDSYAPRATHPTLAVLPEGVMLNYLARRPASMPYTNFMPPELLLFGEAQMLAAFRTHPPDLVLLVHKDTLEYGFPFFGRDYGRELWAWLFENYRPVARFGDEPLLPGSRFGIGVLVKKR